MLISNTHISALDKLILPHIKNGCLEDLDRETMAVPLLKDDILRGVGLVDDESKDMSIYQVGDIIPSVDGVSSISAKECKWRFLC